MLINMNKHLMVLGITVLLICVGLSGCNETSDTNDIEEGIAEYNIGESVIVENIKYTFLSAYWEESGGSYRYKLEIKGQNICNIKQTSYIDIKWYEMENGFRYEPIIPYGYTFFSINPGKEETTTIGCPEDSQFISGIDRDFLPVAKIHLEIREYMSSSEVIMIIINV